MGRHQNYSKRSRESRQAMVGSVGGDRYDYYFDCCDTALDDRWPRDREPGIPQRPSP